MDFFPMSKTHRIAMILASLGLTVCTGSLQAANLLSASAGITLTCNTATGVSGSPSNAITIKLLAANTTGVTVTANAPTGGLTMAAPSPNPALKTTTDSAVFTFGLPAGCAGITPGPQTIQFKQGTTTDVTAVVTVAVTSTATALVPTPSSVTVVCVKSGNTYTPSAAKTVTVTSAATPGGTPFTVDNSGMPSWLSVTPLNPAAASAGGVALSVQAKQGSNCNNNVNTSYAVSLLNAPAPAKTFMVNLQVVGPSPLTANPSPAALNYTKGSGAAGRVDVALTSTPPVFYTVDTSTLPIWLTVDSVTGLTPKTPRFSTTNMADSLAPGTYSAKVSLQVSGFGDLQVPFSLLVTNPAPKFSIKEGLAVTLSWQPGNAPLTTTLTPVSTGSAIPYAITTGGTLAPVIDPQFQNGLAFSFGTGIPVTFDPLVFAAAQPGTTLTGTVTFTWGTPASTTVVTISVNVTSGTATVSGLQPGSLPTATSGQIFYVTMIGSGFVPSNDPSVRTKVGILASPSAPVVTDTNIAWQVIDTSKIYLTITVPAVADAALPFSPAGNGGPVILGVCNPVGGVCTVQTGYATLQIGNNPIITAVTSASAYVQQPAPTQAVAPYDIISIFGTNFCTSGGTGCSSTQILPAAPATNALVYPTQLSPDAPGAAHPRNLTVVFQTHATPPVQIGGNAPLLFATNNQINVMAPSALSTHVGEQVDIVVNFGYGSVPATLLSSSPYGVTVATSSPGVFTVGSDGQGDGAILSSNWTLISSTQPAGLRANQGDSDYVAIYMTGLGEPRSTAANTANSAAAVWSTDCVSTDNYKTSLNSNTVGVTTLDGVVIASKWLAANRLAPCMPTGGQAPAVAVTVGGQAATVQYAGWVQDTIAGLYQVNVLLPSLTAVSGTNSGKFTTKDGAQVAAITDLVQLPVKVAFNGLSSQDGVTMWVAPRLLVTAPSGITNGYLQGTVGTPLVTANNVTKVTATGGTGTFRFAVTSGLLPSGLSLTNGVIQGTPAANTDGVYTITVTATDFSPVPVTGTVTFKIKIGLGLVLSTDGGNPPYTAAFGSIGALTNVSATGGVYPYTFTITSAAVAGMSIDGTAGASSALSMTASLKAGTYTVTVQATDSSPSHVTGTITFDVAIGLAMAHDTILSPSKTSGGAVTTYTTTGQTGTLTYDLDAPSKALGFQISSPGGAISLSSTNTVTGGSTYSVIVTVTDGTLATGAKTGGYGAGTDTIGITVAHVAQTITFNQTLSATYGDAPIALTATASSGLAVTFSASGAGTVNGTSLTISGTGSVTVTAHQAGNGVYSAASDVAQTFVVSKADQTITFNQSLSATYLDAPITLTASTTATGGTVTFTATGAGTVSGNSLTINGAGSVTVTAHSAASTNYNAATDVSQTFVVSKASQTITFAQPADPSMSDVTMSLTGTSSSNLAVTFTVTNVSGTATVNGSTLTLGTAGTVTVTADQAGDSNYLAAPSVSRTITIQP
jgi:hypothetical protein